jgi:hypothetical protein
MGDLQDAAAGCAAGAQTADCENFFQGEFDSNENCGICLEQFDVDFIDLTGIYLCSEPFLTSACNGSTGCANTCATTACQECAGDQLKCEASAITGECSTFVQAGNTCIANSMQASALCSATNYPNFGSWLAAVGAHYCEQ